MLVIYFKSDGEIQHVVSPYKNLKEFYGYRFEEYSLIFDAIYIEGIDDLLFNRYFDFKVNTETRQLELKNLNLIKLIGGSI